MAKTLLNEIKAMNQIAGTQLTKEQEIALIKGRLNELELKEDWASIGQSILHGLEITGIVVLGTIVGAGIKILGLALAMDPSDSFVTKLYRRAKDALYIAKRGKKLNPEVVKGIIDDYKQAIDRIPKKGQRNYMKGLINKLEKADPKDKNAIVKGVDAMNAAARDYGIKNPYADY